MEARREDEETSLGVCPMPRLMLVTDAASAGDATSAQRIEAAVTGGVGIVQLRDRSALAAELFARAQILRKLLPKPLLVVNDRVDVALAVEAAGVQLGTGALPVAEVRRLLGRRALIGRSVHSAAEAVSAEVEGADYLVVGTIYPTDTHSSKAPEGPELLEAVARAVRLPFYAIGGITAGTAGECVRRGAHGVAVIRAITEAADSEQAAHELLAAMYRTLG
jgi:thiamine-phosphate pyrophosphorylase